MLGSIKSLGGAIEALKKHQAASSLIQVSAATRDQVKATVRSEMSKHQGVLKGVFTASQRQALTAFVQEGSAHSLRQPASGGIFGLLSAMKESFETNLKQSQDEEGSNQG